MTGYIAQCNLPTELYHTYSATELAADRYRIRDFKIRYNSAELTGYFTLPVENGLIQSTTLRVGDTVNIILFDTSTKIKHAITLHKVLSKEHNYSAIRLTPTATDYFKSYYHIDDFPLLATQHIEMTIEKTSHLPVVSRLRFHRVNLATPSLLEAIFGTATFFELLIKRYNLNRIVDITLHFGPDGRQRPDLIIKTQSKDGTSNQVIGECKAVSLHYAQTALHNALVQLLFYKTKAAYKSVFQGFLIITGNPILRPWNKLKQIVSNYAQRNPNVKLYRYSRRVNTHIQKYSTLREWYQNNLTLVTGQEIKELIQEASDEPQDRQLYSLLNFIEK